jgi:hypothetical protein
MILHTFWGKYEAFTWGFHIVGLIMKTVEDEELKQST